MRRALVLAELILRAERLIARPAPDLRRVRPLARVLAALALLAGVPRLRPTLRVVLLLSRHALSLGRAPRNGHHPDDRARRGAAGGRETATAGRRPARGADTRSGSAPRRAACRAPCRRRLCWPRRGSGSRRRRRGRETTATEARRGRSRAASARRAGRAPRPRTARA